MSSLPGISSGGVRQAARNARRFAQDLCSPSAVLPFIREPAIVHMGLNRLAPQDWIQPCANLPYYLHNKLAARRRLGERVFAQLPASLPAQRELVTLMAKHLSRDHDTYHCAAGGELRWRDCFGGAGALCWPGADVVRASDEPLWGASLWVADDLCILLPGARGYELVAASLAAPSYWRLEEKIGRPLDAIHKPVPGFHRDLGTQVARFFDHLLPEYPVWRSNWSVVDSAALLQRGADDTGSRDLALDEDALYLRIERQSLRRLPETGAVVFSIRVMTNPLSDLLAVPGGLSALQAAVEAMSPEESRYKSLAPLRAPLQAFFRAHL
ncbi:heme-dependent oxidative N-demethylase family protein [Microbulbifer sp. MCCC 1A16149]|uniref:heme-dependent oxidative N-demethylase family protein n=1 Tax=Microbulbifer sp. MCCC 1A16149 TaxID=3411322 RepID=UPI003D13791A